MSGTPFIINSFGRCGTTYLIEAIRQRRSLPPPFPPNLKYAFIEWHKHLRHPPPRIPEGIDVAYIFGNPMNSIISLFNERDKMYSRNPRLPNWNTMHLEHVQSQWSRDATARRFVAQCSLEDFVERGEDYFELEGHFNSWIDCQQQNYPILYVKSETMFTRENSEELRQFFKLPSLELAEKKRRSDWENHPLREGLLKMYGRLWERIKQQQDISIKPAWGADGHAP